jgi:hypothetical protein
MLRQRVKDEMAFPLLLIFVLGLKAGIGHGDDREETRFPMILEKS